MFLVGAHINLTLPFGFLCYVVESERQREREREREREIERERESNINRKKQLRTPCSIVFLAYFHDTGLAQRKANRKDMFSQYILLSCNIFLFLFLSSFLYIIFVFLSFSILLLLLQQKKQKKEEK